MTSRLRKNLHKMTRKELNNLAKNPYTDDDIQVWLAQHSHTQAQYYLAANGNLCKEAVETLMAGRSRIIKGLLVGSGNIQDPDQIRDIYSQLRFKVDEWRISNFFVRNYWYRDNPVATPSDVLDRIHEDFLEDKNDKGVRRFYKKNLQRGLAQHPNCSVKLAIRLSHSDIPDVKKAGFDALIRLGAQKD